MTQRIFAFFFLTHFVFYAVSPFSAVLPFQQPRASETRQCNLQEIVYSRHVVSVPLERSTDVKGRKEGDINPFLFDMALWKILKEGKPSFDAGGNKFVVEKTGSKNFPEKAKCYVIEKINVVPMPFSEVTARVRTIDISFQINSPLLYSGLSPPAA